MGTMVIGRRGIFGLLRVGCAAAVLMGSAAALARDRDAGSRVSCSGLTSLTFEGNTGITAATVVTSGTLVTPAGQTLTNLPSFCRAQGVSRPSSDSNIYFEVWLPPTPGTGSSSPPAKAAMRARSTTRASGSTAASTSSCGAGMRRPRPTRATSLRINGGR